jgi:lipopolysaccharide biosynthesis glycosyltransferase
LSEPQRFTQRDQCALNYICRGRWSRLELVWNYQPACVLYDDRRDALFHFLGGRKPWQTNHLRHPMRFVKRYQAMYEASPWADEFKAPVLPYAVSEVMRSGKRALSTRHWKDGSLYRKLAQVS